MATYVVTTTNYNSASFWNSIKGGTSGDTLNFSGLPATFQVTFDPITGEILIFNGSTTYTIGNAHETGYDATLGGNATMTRFTSVIGSAGDDTLMGGTSAITLNGGDGSDTFILVAPSAGQTIIGGEGGTDSDTLSWARETDTGVNVTLTGAESGTAAIGGQTVTFSGIETLEGTQTADTFDASATTGGVTIDGLRGNDTITGGSGIDALSGGSADDSISGNAGNDTLYGDGGNDWLDGGDGDDVLYGGETQSNATPGPSSLNWTDVAPAGSDVSAGFTADKDGVEVTVAFTPDASMTAIQTSGSTLYTEAGEPYSATSSLYLAGGAGPTATTHIYFDAKDGSGLADAVTDLSFRISDVDYTLDSWQDIITVNAYDIYGNPIPVTLTAEDPTNDEVSGQTVTAGGTSDFASSASGSVLVEATGEIYELEIIYSNGYSNGQIVFIGDIHYTTLPASGDDTLLGGAGNDQLYGGIGADSLDGGTGDDTLDGGLGADTLDGGAGADHFMVGTGDAASGGDGDDTFVLETSDLGGGSITITGGEGDETAGDTLDFNGQLVQGSIVWSNTDDAAGGMSGTGTLLDGTTVTFSEIETIICFAAGTLVDTPDGPRPVEKLTRGDLVTTDQGDLPLCWIGRRTVTPADMSRSRGLAPIRIAAGALGPGMPECAVTVSANHRVLMTGWPVELFAGRSRALAAAKHLANGTTIRRETPGEPVTYIHLMFESHRLVTTSGMVSESFEPGPVGLATLGPADRRIVERLMARAPAHDHPPMPPTLSRSQARSVRIGIAPPAPALRATAPAKA